MIKFVYGLAIPVEIYSEMRANEKLDVATDGYSFDFAFPEDGEDKSLDEVVFGIDYFVTKDCHLKLTEEFVQGMNDSNQDTANSPVYTEKLQTVLKMWLEAFQRISTSTDKAWEDLTPEERTAKIAPLSLPEQIELSWYIFSYED